MARNNFSLDRKLLVEGAENTDLSFSLAGLGSRILAYFLDSLIQSVAMFLLLLIFGISGLIIPLPYEAGEYVAIALGLLVVFLFFWGYFIIFELAWNGQTPGKKALGIKVVLEDGRPVTFMASFLRNILRVADFLPLSYAVGIISIFVHAGEKRLGDMVAGTLVVKDPRMVPPASFPTLLGREQAAMPASETETSLRQRAHHLSVGEVELLRDFLQRRFTLEAENRHDLALRLGMTLALKLKMEPPADPERFLESLAQTLTKVH